MYFYPINCFYDCAIHCLSALEPTAKGKPESASRVSSSFSLLSIVSSVTCGQPESH
jgi:hypothetical protein